MKTTQLIRLFSLPVLIAAGFIAIRCANPESPKSQDSTSFYSQVMSDPALTEEEKLGKLLFFEKSLSTPEGQDCSFCHDPALAFTDPNKQLPVSKGAVEGLYGSRNDMTISYAAYIPPLHYDEEEEVWVGGLFWDGRSNTLAHQAQQPPLNPLEMANPDTITIFNKIKDLPYIDLLLSVYGSEALASPDIAFDYIADAMEAYQRTPEVSPFTSKYDYYLRGEAELTEQEARGLDLFVAEDKGNCAACHPHTPMDDGTPPLFTDFTYDNLGAPVNPANPYYLLPPEHNPDGFNYVDPGLEATINDPAERGKFRVPTLRNVELTSPYLHHGLFHSLWDVVHFYNTRDIGLWPPPEVPETVNKEELGDLGLTNQEMEDIVAFMLTLTDGWKK
ncbi:MAG: c-type cytochrome [Bacteroidales bacterium]|jgi:cytochrome c peroxidase|nr:c-type cytochrome [Bacteroidales bacterium]MDD3812511.1 cytochrome c peroxidase [Bacteroidales bacterium]